MIWIDIRRPGLISGGSGLIPGNSGLVCSGGWRLI